MKISIVICTINRGIFLLDNLYCLSKQSFKDFEIIIVDDGSTDSTKDIVDHWIEEGLNIKYINTGKPEYSSPAVSRNIGWKAAESEFICFTDPENLIPYNYIEKCLNYHESNPKSITAIRPKMLSEETTKIALSDLDFTVTLLNSCFVEYTEENVQIQRRKSWRDNHFSMMPKQALIDVDGVNENFTEWGFEGIDLIERIMKKGYALYNFIDEEYFVYHRWHEISRNMDLANEQRVKYGTKDCGLKD